MGGPDPDPVQAHVVLNGVQNGGVGVGESGQFRLDSQQARTSLPKMEVLLLGSTSVLELL